MSDAPARIRVLLADDHVLVRDGLKRLVNDQPDMHVVADTGDAREALRLAQAHRPDVALVDISMPGGDGVSVTEEMVRCYPRLRIVAVTRHDDGGFVRRMLNAGASGYVLKQSPSSELLRAIRAVFTGTQYVDPGVTRYVSEPHTAHSDTVPAGQGEPLTAREEDVLRLLAAAWSNQRIAEHLHLELDEVARLKTSAMRKTGLLTRLQIINYARSRGWLTRN